MDVFEQAINPDLNSLVMKESFHDNLKRRISLFVTGNSQGAATNPSMMDKYTDEERKKYKEAVYEYTGSEAGFKATRKEKARVLKRLSKSTHPDRESLISIISSDGCPLYICRLINKISEMFRSEYMESHDKEFGDLIKGYKSELTSSRKVVENMVNIVNSVDETVANHLASVKQDYDDLVWEVYFHVTTQRLLSQRSSSSTPGLPIKNNLTSGQEQTIREAAKSHADEIVNAFKAGVPWAMILKMLQN